MNEISNRVNTLSPMKRKLKKGVTMKQYSFIIPTYNNGELLQNTLEALNLQCGVKMEDFEVIVIDDGSDTDTQSYIKRSNANFQLKYIYLERCSQSCAARARNAGWRSAEGAIIVFIDADIIVKNNYLQELARCYALDPDVLMIGTRLMLKEPTDAMSIRDGSFFRLYQNAADHHEYHEFRYQVFKDVSYNASNLRYHWLVAFTCNMSLPRRYLEIIGGFDENFLGWGLEDVELAYRAFRSGLKIIVGSKLEVYHQFHGYGTDEITPEKYPAIDLNVRYFLSRHADALALSEEEVYKLFRGQLPFVNVRHQEELSNRVVYDFRRRESLAELKENILEVSNREGVKILVYDWVEDTELEVWIQLLGPCKSTPFYYPMLSKPYLRDLLDN